MPRKDDPRRKRVDPASGTLRVMVKEKLPAPGSIIPLAAPVKTPWPSPRRRELKPAPPKTLPLRQVAFDQVGWR